MKHVVCIGKNFEVMDEATIKFVDAFYGSLFGSHDPAWTVEKCFDHAVVCVSSYYADTAYHEEPTKFKLLPEIPEIHKSFIWVSGEHLLKM